MTLLRHPLKIDQDPANPNMHAIMALPYSILKPAFLGPLFDFITLCCHHTGPVYGWVIAPTKRAAYAYFNTTQSFFDGVSAALPKDIAHPFSKVKAYSLHLSLKFSNGSNLQIFSGTEEEARRYLQGRTVNWVHIQ